MGNKGDGGGGGGLIKEGHQISMGIFHTYQRCR